MKTHNIEIRFVFGFLPAIFIMGPGKQQGFDAYCRGIVVRFRSDMTTSEYRQEALRLHELEHVKQFYMTLGLSEILYLKSPRYRLWAEGRAHRVQALLIQEHEGGEIFVHLVNRLMSKRCYDFGDITEEDAWKAIGEPADLAEGQGFEP